MATHQLPQISNEDRFESLVCDLFNAIDSTNTYKRFGRKGHEQKGIDVFSSEKDVVIQCKKKDLSRREIQIRRELMNDIEGDINKIISKGLNIKFSKLYFTSTYKDHPDIDEFCELIKEDKKLEFDVIYWGWDTIEEKIIDKKELIEKYFGHFVVKQDSKEASFLKNLDLKKKIEREFGDWLNYFPEDRKRRSRMILRAFDGTQYPHANEADEYGEYSWFGAEIKGLYYQGMEFIFGIEEIKVYDDNTWDFGERKEGKDFREVKVARVGQINFSDILDYDINGDEHYICPHIFCRFKYKGLPFEKVYFYSLEKGSSEYFELE
ncbi:MAG: hypothetical protein SFV55_10495 [Haliscomenobacter sp.]|uniref:hypothetical protein n=1 Tax=Haliscomenobacter sp. TaxID=2717303 RepID=UPI0029ACCE83|nr:hypothetical protein [Haliscomenobacter sp.]MDX2068846.1 hypothetical protein [Haliscomenobacter sp.]